MHSAQHSLAGQGDSDAEAESLLHASETTRVVRVAHALPAKSIVRKHYLGPGAAQRAARERAILARLQGIEGVVQLAQPLAQEDARAPAIALEDCGDVSLARLLRDGKCGMAFVLAVAPRLARILADVHRAGVVHRDFNPGNILLVGDARPVLIDFDLAEAGELRLPPAPGTEIVGTLGYLAPEQTGRTGRAIDQRADLYSFGATLYEMATGRLPFESRDTLQLLHDHLVREPERPSLVDARVPGILGDIILRLLAKAPEQRYQSAEGVLHDLKRVREQLDPGGDALFELGERDFPAVLPPLPQLVGRDAEVAVLKSAFDRAMTSSERIMFVEGAAGVGKTALVGELRSIAAAAGGWFVYGKCDPFQKDNATTGALLQALQSLGRLLLAQAPGESERLRERVLLELGRGAGLITKLLPEFELLLGTQPEPPQVDPAQAGLQLQAAMVALLAAVVSPVRPLVIVLDDLQWTSARLLRALGRLLDEPALRGLLVVGVHRPDEDDGEPSLQEALAGWRERRDPPRELKLAQLPAAGTAEIIARMLRLADERADELAKAVHRHTAGNPFDTVETINALRTEGLLRLGESGWEWDPAQIGGFVGRSDVAGLLAVRIARLPEDSRRLMEVMGCIGGAIDPTMLGAAAALEPSEVEDRLRPLLEDGLVTADRGGDGVVRFRHDRVQQAVLRALGDPARAHLQLSMARRLAAGGFEDEAAAHYLACAALVEDAGEMRLAARLFHGLARRLAATAAYALAERYLAQASALLARVADPADAGLRREILVAHHVSLYSQGRQDECDVVFASIEACTADPLDTVHSADLQMHSLMMRMRLGEAASLGYGLLERLGVELPAMDAAAKQDRLAGLREWIRLDAQRHRPDRMQMHDPRLLAICTVLRRMTRPAGNGFDVEVTQRILLLGLRLWTAHGPCPDLVACIGYLSGVLIAEREDFRTAYELARHFMRVGEDLRYESQARAARLIFAALACHWMEPLESAVGHARSIAEAARSAGEWAVAGSFLLWVSTSAMEIAPTMAQAAAEMRSGIDLCRRSGNVHAGHVHSRQLQLLRALHGESKGDEAFGADDWNEEEFQASAKNSPYLRLQDSVCLGIHALIMGDADALLLHARSARERLVPGIQAYHVSFHVRLLSALARVRELRPGGEGGVDASVPPQQLQQLDADLRWLADRAADQPDNFLHLLRLVEAERAWAMRDGTRAAACFDAALAETEHRKRPWHRALIAERAGLFHLSEGLGQFGRRLLVEAHGRYRRWGAAEKGLRMEREHPFLQAPGASDDVAAAPRSARGSDSVSSDSLDLVGVLRASQALSSETSLARLTSRMTEVLAALTGATKVLVLSWVEGEWRLNAPSAGEAAVSAERAAAEGLVPASVLRYAERTQVALVVDDALADDRFARDPYFAGVPLCSLMAVMISGQGAARTLLLLENRQGRAAFNDRRLDAVMLIAGQLAVSMANAQLYERLEQRVQARTRELRETQAQLVATARRVGMAEIANNVLHNVGNVLNSISVSAGVMRSTIGNSSVQKLERAVQLMNDHAHELAQFMAAEGRDRAMLGYLNEIAAALGRERAGMLEDLDRLVQGVDHIGYVVADQQSRSGPSSMLEPARPQDLLEEALRMSAEPIGRIGVEIVRRYEELPSTVLDKPRMLLVLVNLICNASQAMEGMPEGARQLTLESRLQREDEGERLHITVRDSGEGISEDNLKRLFAHGFSTRRNGHGFGLHSSALAAMEMGGRLAARSEGPGRGAAFTLDVPFTAQGRPAGAAPSRAG
jgi:predicted ATPase/signal transduction histidine kinase